MLKLATIKTWYLVHKWTRLACTVFLLLLCATGLPLIFHHKIDHWFGAAVELAAMPADTPRVSLDRGYTRSVGRWRRYCEHLPQLVTAFAGFDSILNWRQAYDPLYMGTGVSDIFIRGAVNPGATRAGAAGSESRGAA